jgi:hypothetical protein
MKYANILTYLAGTEEGKALVSDFTALVNENTTTKAQLETAEKKVTSLGDRDVGELIATSDWLKENGLDTPEKLAEYKSKADGLELTNSELKSSSEALKEKLEQESTKVNENATMTMLKADVKVALAPKMSDKKALAVDDMFKSGLVTKGEDGTIFYGTDGNVKLDDSAEAYRADYPFAFAEKPSGTGNPPKAGEAPQIGAPNSNKPYWKK